MTPLTLDEAVHQFITNNPYPSYDNMLDYIEKRIDLGSEYGEANHEYCKYMYENLNNKVIVNNMAMAIYNQGGIMALNANLDIIRLFSPLYNFEKVDEKMNAIIQYLNESLEN